MRKQELQSLEVLILCGGKGSRLQSVVSDRPKSMALLRGHPFLEWQLLSLREIGFRKVVLCTGYMEFVIREYFGTGEMMALQIEYVNEEQAMGTGGALRNALAVIQTDMVLVFNGDSWCDINLSQFYNFHQTHDAMGTLGLTTVPDPQRYGQVVLGRNGRIHGFTEKGSSVNAGWINAGVYLLSRAYLKSIPEEACVSLEYDMFPQWIEHGLYGFTGEHHFFDIGTPVSYFQAEQNFEQVFHMAQKQGMGMEQRV